MGQYQTVNSLFLTKQLGTLGFEQEEGKGVGVTNKMMTFHDEDMRVLALVSRRDVTFKFFPQVKYKSPYVFRFNDDFAMAFKFIRGVIHE